MLLHEWKKIFYFLKIIFGLHNMSLPVDDFYDVYGMIGNNQTYLLY